MHKTRVDFLHPGTSTSPKATHFYSLSIIRLTRWTFPSTNTRVLQNAFLGIDDITLR